MKNGIQNLSDCLHIPVSARLFEIVLKGKVGPILTCFGVKIILTPKTF